MGSAVQPTCSRSPQVSSSSSPSPQASLCSNRTSSSSSSSSRLPRLSTRARPCLRPPCSSHSRSRATTCSPLSCEGTRACHHLHKHQHNYHCLDSNSSNNNNNNNSPTPCQRASSIPHSDHMPPLHPLLLLLVPRSQVSCQAAIPMVSRTRDMQLAATQLAATHSRATRTSTEWEHKLIPTHAVSKKKKKKG